MTFDNLAVHALNSVFVLLDRCLSAIPVRVLHFWHCSVYGAVYAIFTGIYYAVGGTNGEDPYIYPILDFAESPGIGAAWLLALIFPGVILIHTIMFLIYLFREWLASKCCKKQSKVGEESKIEGQDNKAYDEESADTKAQVV